MISDLMISGLRFYDLCFTVYDLRLIMVTLGFIVYSLGFSNFKM